MLPLTLYIPGFDKHVIRDGIPRIVRYAAQCDNSSPSMNGNLTHHLSVDHVKLDGALRRAMDNPQVVDMAAYAEFREGLLRHIGMEEKILLPAARKANGGKPLASEERLHLDHCALAALLVLTPTPAILSMIKTILEKHNPLEEGPGAVYEECEQLLGAEIDAVLGRLTAAPRVRVAPHADSAISFESARIALRNAGYDFSL